MVVASSPLDLFPVVRLRALPFNCTDIDIFKFFAGLDIVDVLLVNKSGQFSGEVFNCFAGSMQVEIAMQRDRQNMGRRYHYKKNCFSPIAGRHVYGHCTRGELLAACKSPRKYTRPTRLRLTAQLAACIIIHVAICFFLKKN
jgi:hypothetical protein